MKCERCGVTPLQESSETFDYCDNCFKKLCPECMKEGCCGRKPAGSGLREYYRVEISQD